MCILSFRAHACIATPKSGASALFFGILSLHMHACIATLMSMDRLCDLWLSLHTHACIATDNDGLIRYKALLSLHTHACIATPSGMVMSRVSSSFTSYARVYCDSKKLCKSHICAVFSLCNTSNTYACSVWRRTLCRQFIGANLPAFLCSLIIRTQP